MEEQGSGFEGYEEIQVPASVHLEIAILGTMLLESSACHVAMETLVPSDFFLDSHQRIYRAICDMMDAGQAVDANVVREELTRRKELSTIGGPTYLAYLTEGIPRNFNIESYVSIVKDKSRLRETISQCAVAVTRCNDGSEPSSVILEELESSLMAIADGMQTRKFTTLVEAVREKGGVDDYIAATFDPSAMTGLKTGYHDFDAMTGGLKEEELTIIAARPSIGKSALMINIATNVVQENVEAVIAIFSIEMAKSALHRRMIASVAGVGARKAMMGWLSSEEKRKLASTLLELTPLNLMIDDTPSITPMQMRAKCRRLKAQKGQLDLVMVDYLQLMAAGKKAENRQQEVAIVSRSLKALAKELKVPVVALAQLSRASEHRGGDKRPTLADLRESGQIEQDGDVIAFIHRPEYYDPDNLELKGLAEIIIAKARDGPTGTVHLVYLTDITRFENPEKR